MSKYLYGANVSGIQKYITATNKLKEIVGASELIEFVTKELIYEVLGDKMELDENLIQAAAGHIRYIFNDRATCEKVVLQMPKLVAEKAPGLEFYQAVKKFDGDFKKDIWDEIENKLKQQRNKPVAPVFAGLMATQNSRRTGNPAVMKSLGKIEFPDAASLARLNAFENLRLLEAKSKPGAFQDINSPSNMEEWAETGEWLAVIHADGNGLGQALLHLWKEKWNNNDAAQKIKDFSHQLEKATEEAFKEAVLETFDDLENYQNQKVLPYRSIIIGGDDVTVICKAQHALKFVKEFTEKFEKNTKHNISDVKGEGFTICSGIAFVKPNYPFSQAYELADMLCKKSKKNSKENRVKGRIPSSLSFYKVQSSFVQSVETTFVNEFTCDGLSFDCGPYVVNQEDSQILVSLNELLKAAKELNSFDTIQTKKGVKSKIRKWLALVKTNQGVKEANQLVERLIKQNGIKSEELQILGVFDSYSQKPKSIAHDALTISNLLKNQEVYESEYQD